MFLLTNFILFIVANFSNNCEGIVSVNWPDFLVFSSVCMNMTYVKEEKVSSILSFIQVNLSLNYFRCCVRLAILAWSIYEIIHIWTAVVDESEEWSSQLNFQCKQLERRSLKKYGLQRYSNPWPPRCSTNWAMKPHVRSEVDLLSLAILLHQAAHFNM